MSHSRYRILWMVACLLFVMLVAGCTAVQDDVEPEANIKVDAIEATKGEELSDSIIEQESGENNIDELVFSGSLGTQGVMGKTEEDKIGF